jgi:hypothetical protein
MYTQQQNQILGIRSHGRLVLAGLVVFLLGLGQEQHVSAQEPLPFRIEVDPAQNVVFSTTAHSLPDSVYRLEESDDLSFWSLFALTHDGLAPLADLRGRASSTRFYRLVILDKTIEDDWANQLVLDQREAFQSPQSQEEGASRWIKFMILLNAPHLVIFQDSSKYPFHFDFAMKRVPVFQDADPITFDRLTLWKDGQRAVLGALVLAPDPGVQEFGIQFAGNEAFAVEDVADWFDLVRQSIVAPPDSEAFYFPSFEQSFSAVENEGFFAARGIALSSAARWASTDQCYSQGWAFGRLVVLDAGSIEGAYSDGRLTHNDILVTDAVPAEIPPVAGLITLSPATPNSHVAILSKSFRIPFAFLARKEDRARVQSWAGQEIIFLASANGGQCSVSTFNVEGKLTSAQRTRLLEAVEPPVLTISPMQWAGVLTMPVEALTPEDIRFVGGKSANFGFLRRAIPAASPDPAVALTFDLWIEFMQQTLPTGKSLGHTISEKLSRYSFPPNIASMRSDLAEIRGLIRTESVFDEEQTAAVLAALEPFSADRKIRFRSSTNVEDSDQFVGAGLYDSYSGCLADDTDGDDAGPSHCDADRSNERGVFRAIRKVYASFYNDNAFLERLRHGVDESTVGMGVLVHHSFPDSIELANGVGTMRVTRDGEGVRLEGELVSQAGAASVANPDSNALPEVVSVLKPSALANPSFSFQQRSSLVPLGGSVLEQNSEYLELTMLLKDASEAFLAAAPQRDEVLLDFEYKKVAPDDLVVKQIREIPHVIATGGDEPPFVLNDLGQLDIFQHHGKDLYANFRLKSVLDFQALQFDDASIAGAFDFAVDAQYHDGQTVLDYNGLMSDLPRSAIDARSNQVTYAWTWGQGDEQRDYTLELTFPGEVEDREIVALSDATLIELSARYATPQPRLSALWQPEITYVREETTRMVSLERIVDGTIERNRTFTQGDVTVTIAYTLGFLDMFAPGVGIFDSKSFPLVNWNGSTTITGLTSQPVLLEGHYSRTYDSNRHNFFETFLLVPHLEGGIDPGLLAELRDKNVQGIIVSQFTADAHSEPSIHLWGFDNSLREL